MTGQLALGEGRTWDAREWVAWYSTPRLDRYRNVQPDFVWMRLIHAAAAFVGSAQ